MEKLSYKEAVEFFRYENGRLFWSLPTKGRRKNGSEAGTVNKNNGHRVIEIAGKPYHRSHIVWLMHNKRFPDGRLDHINQNVLDDRIENLRLVTSNCLKVDYELVQRVFEYKNGFLFWKEKPILRSQLKVGDKAGYVQTSKDHHYRFIKIGGERYKAANLIWLYHNGVWPNKILDHINHITTDDRIENLREVTSSENSKNRSKGKYGKYGVLGVHKRDGKYIARISINRKRIEVGRFNTKEEAITARKAAEKIHGYHENHGK